MEQYQPEAIRRELEQSIYEWRRLNLQRDPRVERVIAKHLAGVALTAIENSIDADFSAAAIEQLISIYGEKGSN